MQGHPRLRLLALLAALVLTATACGGGGGDPAAEGSGGGDLIVGTTDTVTTIDPAKCYSYYCSNILQNVGNTLVGYEPGAVEIAPQLATALPEISADGLTYTFTLREGVTFHDGSEMTAEDVVFSLNRGRLLQHPEGASFLLAGIQSVEAPDPLTVVVTLSEPDITFASKLAYTVATILPSDGPYQAPTEPVSDADAAEQFINEEQFVGTGPYRLTDLRENQSITLEAFENFYGDQPANARTLVRFYAESAQLKAALEAGEVDVAYRALSTAQREALAGNPDITTVEGTGASIRYLVLNTGLEPVDDVNVRKALAAAVDRDRLVEEVLAGAAEPLYSMIAPGFEAYEPTFQDVYADAEPGEFIQAPVEIDLWYSTDHYGPAEPSIAQTLERTLEETGMFQVNLQSTEWAQFTTQAYPGDTGTYPVFLLGWYPDYLDPDDYIYPFYHSDQSFLQMYANPEMDRLIEAEQTAAAPDSPERMATFAQIQQLAAQDAPLIPLYVETPFAFARSNVTGVDSTMGPAQIFRYYVISTTGA